MSFQLWNQTARLLLNFSRGNYLQQPYLITANERREICSLMHGLALLNTHSASFDVRKTCHSLGSWRTLQILSNKVALHVVISGIIKAGWKTTSCMQSPVVFVQTLMASLSPLTPYFRIVDLEKREDCKQYTKQSNIYYQLRICIQ